MSANSSVRNFIFYYKRPDGQKFYHCNDFCAVSLDLAKAKVYPCPSDLDPDIFIRVDVFRRIRQRFEYLVLLRPDLSSSEIFGDCIIDEILLECEEVSQ
jgi:hypothetical protein